MWCGGGCQAAQDLAEEMIEEEVPSLKRSRAGKGPMIRHAFAMEEEGDEEILEYARKYKQLMWDLLSCPEIYEDIERELFANKK